MLLFVDGGTGRTGAEIKHGGIGCVAVEHNGRTRITGFGKFFHHDTFVTNQRMELRAIHFAIEALKLLGKPQSEPLFIWSDSVYAINTLKQGTTWEPKQNLDIIVPFQEELRSLNIVSMNHVKSHMHRKTRGSVPNFMLHEMADKLASVAIQKKTFVQTPIMRQQKVDTKCLSCSLFPCRQRKELLGRMRIQEDYISCKDYTPLGSAMIKHFSEKELEVYCP